MHMKIASIFVRNFRSLRCVDVPHCSAVNAIIGKNNAGKSNVLAAIDMAAGQFRLGNVTSEWPTRGRPLDKYFGRDTANRIQIGMQFDASAEFIARAKELIASGVEGIDVPLSSINEKSSFYIIVSGHFRAGKIARYVEALGFGTLHSDAERLTASGVKIFQLPDQIADEVIDNERLISELQENSESIDRAVVEISPNLREDREYRKYMIARIVESRPLNRDLNVAMQNAAQDASDSADFEKRVLPHKASIQSRVAEVRAKLTSEPMQAFSGFVRKVPDYVPEIITELGKINILHFEVAKPAIGSEEASQLLKLKTTRGGPVQLSAFQNVVQSLLGVSVDAFSPEGEGLVRRGRNAEMDIDDFLVDANGSGIREALRIVLDIELKKPDIVLIEEPEVHLHPGLEKAVHSYLNEKGQTQQIFIATHSTNFLDVSSRQNVYVASRHGLETRIEKVASEDDILRIPADIGLRPSTLFMFDRLAFVEGPTDEDMIRAFSKTLGVESALKNVGFVKLGGASNIVYYSIDATLDLLSKRQIPMTFVLDRDERSDAETQKIEKRLGSRASFVVLSRRELENYLLDPEAIRSVDRGRDAHC